MATAHRIKPVLSRLALLGGIAAALAAGPAAAQNVPWVIQVFPARTPAVGCRGVISTTARGAVQRCLAKVGVTPIHVHRFCRHRRPGLQDDACRDLEPGHRLRLLEPAVADPAAGLCLVAQRP